MSKVVSRDWQPRLDRGPGNRASLGFILMSTDLVVEADTFHMAPDGVSVHFTRIKTKDFTTNETLANHVNHLAEAASNLQPDARPDVVSYSCTSGSIVIGEERVCAEIQTGAPWTKPMCIATGVMDAFRTLGVTNIAVGTPYLDEINALEAAWLQNNGLNISDIQGLNLATGVEFGRVKPTFLRDFAIAIDTPEADAVFLSCSGIRALEVVPEIEATIGKPVVTSNQAQMWSCLRRAGVTDQLQGFGRLFQKTYIAA